MTVFLGNPGRQYEQTRHNMARMLLNALLSPEEIIWREKFHGYIADWFTEECRCRLLQSGTFMNQSGKSTAAAAAFHKVKAEELLVVHDDLEIPFGTYAWREGGGLGGHNGLRSIREQLGTADFMRFRLGIGRPKHGSVHSWVLGRFSPDEEAVLPLILNAAAADLRKIINGTITISANPKIVTVPNAGDT